MTLLAIVVIAVGGWLIGVGIAALFGKLLGVPVCIILTIILAGLWGHFAGKFAGEVIFESHR